MRKGRRGKGEEGACVEVGRGKGANLRGVVRLVGEGHEGGEGLRTS